MARTGGLRQWRTAIDRSLPERGVNLELEVLDRLVEGVAYELDLATGIARYGPGISALLGEEISDGLMDTAAWRRRLHPDDRGRMLRAWRAAMDGLAPADFLYRFRRADDRYIYVSDRVHFVRDRGMPVRAIGVLRDVSTLHEDLEREHPEQRLRRSIAANLPVPVVALDSDRRIIFANDAFGELIGGDAAQLAGATPPFVFLEGKSQETLDWLLEGPDAPSTGVAELQIARRDGATRTVAVRRAPLLDGGRAHGSCLLFEDVTVTRERERVLASVAERLGTIVQAGRLTTWDWFIEHDRVVWDHDGAGIFRDLLEEVPETFASCLQVIHPDDRDFVSAAIEGFLTVGPEFDCEYRVQAPNGKVRWMRAFGRFIPTGGSERRASGVLMDVTEHKVAERRLRMIRQAVETSSHGIALYSPEGEEIFANAAHARLLSHPHLLLGDDARPDDLLRGEHAQRRRIVEARDAEGRLRTLDIELALVHDENGTAIGWLQTISDLTDRRTVEAELHIIRQAFASANEGILVLDGDGELLYCNQAMLRLYEATPEHMTQSGRRSLFRDPDEHRILVENLRMGNSVVMDAHMRTFGGREFVARIRADQVRNQAGELVGYVGIHTDITQQHRTDRQRQTLAAILEATPDFVATVREDGTAAYLNAAARAWLNVDSAEGLNLSDRHPDNSLFAIINEGIPTALASGSWSGETQIVRADGSVADVSEVLLARDYPDEDGVVYSVIARDITASKAANEELRLVRLAMDAATDGIVVVDGELKVRYLNPSLTRILGLTEQELPGALRHLMTEHQTVAGNLLPAVLAGGSWEGNLDLPHAKGHMVPTTARVNAVRDGDRMVAIVAILSDRTETEKLQAQVLQAEKLAALGQLVAGVAHEVNNPLAAISAASQLLTTASPEVADRAALIHRMATRATKIVRSLLTFARRSDGVRATVSLNALVEDTLEVGSHILRQSEVELVSRYSPQPPYVLVNENQVQQILLNLLSNAEHAVREREPGSRRVELRTDIQASPSGDLWAVLAVRDNGAGIPAEIRDRIFDPFFTTKDVGVGTGLGLSVCHGIAVAHGGQLELDSVPGEGTEFRLVLPLVLHHGEETCHASNAD